MSDSDIAIPSEDGSEIFEFDREGRHLRTLNALTAEIRYEFAYDANGLLISITDGDGNVTTIERDGSGNPMGIEGPDGQVTSLSLDANGYLSAVTNPAEETVSFGYSDDGLMTSMTDASTNTYAFTYDGGGRLIRDEDPEGGSKELALAEDEDGYTVTLETALGRTTTYRGESLPAGDRRSVRTEPNGTVTETLVRTDGTTEITSADGTAQTLIQGPDPRFGMLAPVAASRTMTTPGDVVSTVTTERTVTLDDPADPLSLTEQVDTVTVNGREFVTAFDAASSTVTQTSAELRETVSTLDAQGRVTKSEVTGLHPVRRVYDTRGRLTAIKHGPDPDTADTRTTAFAYKDNEDATNGYLDGITDPLGRTVSFEYDDAGRVTSQTLPDERVIAYTYDPNGNVTSITPPGRPAHGFAYTGVNLEEEYTPPQPSPPLSDPRTTYTYNLDRELTEIARPDGKTVDFAYDTAGRLETVTLEPAGEERTYAYDATTGQLESIAAPDATVSFAYDGALPTEETWTGEITGSVTRTYDNDFRVASVQVNAGTAVELTYDGDGLLTQAGSLALSRDAINGLLTGTTLDSVTDTLTYTPFGELASYTAEEGSNDLLSVEYVRDKLGRITQKTESVEGGSAGDTFYKYDVAGRLWRVCADDACNTIQSEYLYDANGNRTDDSFTATHGTVLTATYDNQDRLLEYETTLGGDVEFAYTENGDLSSKTAGSQTTEYVYDALGNLRTVTLPNDDEIEYLVDGRNRRVGKKVNGTPVQGFVYQDQLNPIAELDGNGDIVAEFVYGSKPNVPDYILNGGETYRIISDHLGSPRLVVDVSDGSVVQRIDYDEFGNVLDDTNPGFQPFGFAGGLYDPDTGLVRFGARDYDAEVGRWLAKDPIRFGGGDFNLYGYVLGDPVNLSDPFGLFGTNDCSYYQQRCNESGGSYYCQTAQFFCNSVFPKYPDPDPTIDDDYEGWSRCTRQCLQDCDRGVSAGQNECPSEPDENTDDFWDPQNYACHEQCYLQCGVFQTILGPSPAF